MGLALFRLPARALAALLLAASTAQAHLPVRPGAGGLRASPSPSATLPSALPPLSAPSAVGLAALPSLPAGLAASPQARGASPKERTGAFLLAYSEAEKALPAPPEAKETRYLVVPGLFWDWIPGLYKPNIRALQEMGLETELVRVSGLGRSKENARAVAEAIARSPRPVVLLTHSKGGLDALEALAQEPGLQAKVRALIAIQTPYFGSPAVDLLAAVPRLRLAMQTGARLLNVRKEKLKALFHDTLAELAPGGPRPEVPAGLRVVSLVSNALDRPGRLHPLRLTRWALLKLKGKDSDGLVSPEDAVLPGSEAVRLSGLNHGDAVLDPLIGLRRSSAYDAQRLTRALVHYLSRERP